MDVQMGIRSVIVVKLISFQFYSGLSVLERLPWPNRDLSNTLALPKRDRNFKDALKFVMGLE